VTCQVENGNDIQIRCVGTVAQCKLVSSHKEINFGAISIGNEAHQNTMLRNMSKNVALFHVRNKIEGLTVTPTFGKLGANDKVELVFKVDTS